MYGEKTPGRTEQEADRLVRRLLESPRQEMIMTWNQTVTLEAVRGSQDDEYVLRLESTEFSSGLVWGHD